MSDDAKEDFVAVALDGNDAADALIYLDEPSRRRALFDVYRAYGWPQPEGSYSTAQQAWDDSVDTHVDPFPPRGVPVYWGNKENHPGLVGISAGHGLVVVSNVDPDRVIVVGIMWVTETTGLSYLGWSERFMGHPVMWDGRKLGL
jgi:hypothetical protein